MSEVVRLPGWIWHGLVLVGFGAAVAIIGTWAGTQIQDGRNTNEQQNITISNHELRINNLESANKRIEEKLDRILERLPPSR